MGMEIRRGAAYQSAAAQIFQKKDAARNDAVPVKEGRSTASQDTYEPRRNQESETTGVLYTPADWRKNDQGISPDYPDFSTMTPDSAMETALSHPDEPDFDLLDAFIEWQIHQIVQGKERHSKC